MSNDKILNEIGEMFGRYKEANGSLSFFRQKMNKATGGFVNDFDSYLKNIKYKPQPQADPEDPFLKGILNSKFYADRFYPWQRRVLDRLQNPKNDIYVVAPPGGGKTTPLMAHYVVDMLMDGRNGDARALQSKDIFSTSINATVIRTWSNIFTALLTKKFLDGKPAPRCLFVTPIRVLAFEQAEGFQDYFIDLILLLKSIIAKVTQDTPKNKNESFPSYMARLDQVQNNMSRIVAMTFRAAGEARLNSFDVSGDAFNSFAKQFSEKLIHVKTGGGSGVYDTPPEQTLVSIATYGSAKNFISKISNLVKFIVFDEAHLYMPSEYGPKSDRSQENEVRAAADAYTIIEGMAKQKDAQIAFLSGTIHPISAQNFCDFLNRRYGRNLAVVTTDKGDTKAGNQTELHVIADDAIRNEREQVNRIVQWVQRNEKGNAIILFSKQKINKLVDEAIKRLSQKDIRQDFNVNQSDRYRNEKIDRYRRSLALTNPDADSETIKREVDAFIRREFPTSQQEKVEKIKAKPGAMMIQNKKLREAVSYGIGYIYTQDDVSLTDPKAIVGEVVEPITEQDKLIVAKLFSEGKINVLIATAAIGVGVNVSIKNMYLPSCMKFERNKNNDGKFDLNNKREMSQLVNRTGRGVTKISGIYTPSEFVPFMKEVVMSGISDFNKVPAISVRHSDNLKDMLLDLSVAASNIKDYPINKSKSAGNYVINKLTSFSRWMKSKYSGKPTDQLNNDLSWREEKLDAELKRNQADRERLRSYSAAETRIEDFEKRIADLERGIKDQENKITEWEQELAGLRQNNPAPNQARRDTLARFLVLWKDNLRQSFVDQKFLVVDECNAIIKLLNDIHETSSESNWHGSRASKYNKTFLMNRLKAIQKTYGLKDVESRNARIEVINSELNNYNQLLKNDMDRYNAAVADPNVPQNVRDELQKNIRDRQRYITQMIEKYRGMKFSDFTPTSTVNQSNLRI